MRTEQSGDGFWAGARDILPLAAGVSVYGLAFGLLAAQAGFSPLQIGAMGALVYAGSSQIIMSQQWLAGAGFAGSVVAGLILNLRLLLITASLRDVFAGRPWWQTAFGAHLAADENWALLLAGRARGRRVGYAYLIGGGLAQMAAWCGSTTAGGLFAEAIPDPRGLGIDFAFTAAFIAIARSLWRGRSDLLPWFVSVAVVFAGVKLAGAPAHWMLALGGLIGAATAGARA
ncbi:putative branched-subunit amino acid permease [Roseiarcus fermentans]|uniref:Putative branched-subunit amino acid permease n=1 Tax=Roseiarcus fermentans TaxID=1473586 RepID=A0A366FJW6_9HYPH|nr:AzlC family ABC transporter permease [Roseiarcus fermentans]RBP14406.1 putative branched-subunit amino acid permease [Roseiarcus fermentans]